MFADFEVLGGDFAPSKESNVTFGKFPTYKAALIKNTFYMSVEREGKFEPVDVPLEQAKSFEEIDADSANVKDTALFGALGAVALGPIGLLAGGALGAFNKNKTFVVTFEDGRRMVGVADRLANSNLKKAFALKGLL